MLLILYYSKLSTNIAPRTMFLMIALLAMIASTNKADSTMYTECLTSDDCGSFSCCVLGLNRFNYPACKPYQELGQSCLAGKQTSFNISLAYPDNQTIEFTKVYYLLCPCNVGFVCGEDSLCAEMASSFEQNLIDIED